MVSPIIGELYTCIDAKQSFLLSGGAGSGKTHTLIEAISHSLRNNNHAKIACITFTNVAANEIKERAPYTNLTVSTIHDFLWNQISDYQKNLKRAIIQLVINEKENEGTGLTYNGDQELVDIEYPNVSYKNYRKLEAGVISHDDLLKVSNYMFRNYPMLTRILSDKYDYIFIDEYQDTQKLVIEIFLDYVLSYSPAKICIGLFGDKMQSIYDTGIGDIQKYIDIGKVKELIKEDNFRCSINVINLLNKVRTDLEQKPAKMNEVGSIQNKEGSAIFMYSQNDFDLEWFKTTDYAKDWDVDDYKETKVLYLTHKLSAKKLGFFELLDAYSNADKLIGNEPDKLAEYMLKIGSMIYSFIERKYSEVIEIINRNLESNADKQAISSVLETLISNIEMMNIEELFYFINKENLVVMDDNLAEYFNKYEDIICKIKPLPAKQVLSYYNYFNKFSPYSTQHGVKGAEFNNVLVIMDNGKWNNYNFKYLFENTADKEKIIMRTKRIFYVCCSRAMNNLIVYYPKPSAQILNTAKELFGESNIVSV